MNLGK